MKTLRRFFDDIHRIANAVNANRMQEMLVVLSPADRDALVEAATKFRRNGPRAKKEVA